MSSKRQRSAGDSVFYFANPRVESLSRLAFESIHPERSSIVHSLVKACCFGERGSPSLKALSSYAPASEDSLRDFHDARYLSALRAPEALSAEELQSAGLADDCPPFKGALEYARLVAGGSLEAADALAAGRCRAAIHLDGGRHHARRGAAAGFCYVNDAVLALLRLTRGRRRALYVDVDVHHGDGVAEAFYASDAVTAVSLHIRKPGFFPGTGSPEEAGAGRGRGHTLNVPLADGLRDELFLEAFERVAGGAYEIVRPDFVVLCCGADGLARDPLGGWALTPAALAAVARTAKGWGAPLLVLGGGGYRCVNAARAWAAVTAAVAQMALPDDVPLHEFSNLYGPSYSMRGDDDASRPDENDEEEVLAVCDDVLGRLRAAVQGTSSVRQAQAQAQAVAADEGSDSESDSEEQEEEEEEEEEACEAEPGGSSGGEDDDAEGEGRASKRRAGETEGASAESQRGAAEGSSGAAGPPADAEQQRPPPECGAAGAGASTSFSVAAAGAASASFEPAAEEADTDSPLASSGSGSSGCGFASLNSDSLSPAGEGGVSSDEAWWRELRRGLVLILGPMRSGKTSETFRVHGLLQRLGAGILVVKPDVDGRSLGGSQPDEVATRDPAHGGRKLKALVVPRSGLCALPALLAAAPEASCVIVDEVQFFDEDPGSVRALVEAAALRPVVCAGLDLSSEREEWPMVAALRAHAAAVFTLCASRLQGLTRTARCEGCEGRAQFTFCTQEKDGPILIGDDAYVPLCGGCFDERERSRSPQQQLA